MKSWTAVPHTRRVSPSRTSLSKPQDAEREKKRLQLSCSAPGARRSLSTYAPLLRGLSTDAQRSVLRGGARGSVLSIAEHRCSGVGARCSVVGARCSGVGAQGSVLGTPEQRTWCSGVMLGVALSGAVPNCSPRLFLDISSDGRHSTCSPKNIGGSNWVQSRTGVKNFWC